MSPRIAPMNTAACTRDLLTRRPLFTGKERDAESGLDNFGARFFNSITGRFESPDWANEAEPVPYAKLGNPQTLNLYAYVANNPESTTDLDGHKFQPLLEAAMHARDEGFDHENNTVMEQEAEDAEQQYEEEVAQSQQDAQPAASVTPDPNAAAPAQQTSADQKLTNVVYNESGSLRANSKVKAGAKGSAEDLANGRQAIAEIANRVINAGHPNRVAPSDLRDNAAMKTDAYALSRTAGGWPRSR